MLDRANSRTAWGSWPSTWPESALSAGLTIGGGHPDRDLVDLRSTPKGLTIQTYRTTGRPQYEAVTA
ncbi:hypothetical protein ACWCRD_25975 [Streptomyces sp. NPDC002092]